MTHDRWIEVKNNILEQFAVNDQGKEEYADQPGFFEFIDFIPKFFNSNPSEGEEIAWDFAHLGES